jgi:hypothetical protein
MSDRAGKLPRAIPTIGRCGCIPLSDLPVVAGRIGEVEPPEVVVEVSGATVGRSARGDQPRDEGDGPQTCSLPYDDDRPGLALPQDRG